MDKTLRVVFRCLALAVLVPLQFHFFIFVRSAEYVYVEGEKLMLGGEQFVVKGYNYYPRDYGWTSMVDWDWEEVDRELALASEYGANTIRTGFSFQYATGNLSCDNLLVDNQVKPEYLDAIQHLLDIAEKYNLKVIFWLGDLCWKFWNPVYYSGLQHYLESIIPSFATDSRILAWDLVTDLDGSMLQRPPVGGYITQYDGDG